MSYHYNETEYESGTDNTVWLYGYEKLLTPEKVLELSKKIKQGDAEAREKLIISNIRLVISVARKYKGRGLPMEDLIQEGITGLMEAADKYDHTTYGTMFSTYAYDLIRYAILNALEKTSRIIRLPSEVFRKVNDFKTVVGQLTQELDRKPNISEISERMAVSEDEVRKIMKLRYDAGSLDEPLKDDEEKSLKDKLEDSSSFSLEETIEAKMLRKHMHEFIKMLPERAQKVIILRFGLDGVKPMTLEEVSIIMSISRERVRQIEAEALRKLKNNGKARKTLKDFY